jgi:hypothetical protein
VIAGIEGREGVENSNFLPKRRKDGPLGGVFGDLGAVTRPLPTGVRQARQVPIVRIPFRMEQF